MFKPDRTQPGYRDTGDLTPVTYRYRWREMRVERL
jgi:hypothetical protein